MKDQLPKCKNIVLETISRQDQIEHKELAYLIGVYLTDASITECNFNLQVIDKDFAERVLEYWKIFIPTTKAYLRKRCERKGWNKSDRYVIKLGIGEYAKFFKKITEDKFKIPIQILNSELNIKKWFIAGVMDGDGWISKTERKKYPGLFQYRIGIGGIKSTWIIEFRNMLISLNVIPLKMEEFITKNGKIFCRFNVKPISFFNAGLFFMLDRKVRRCLVASTTAR